MSSSSSTSSSPGLRLCYCKKTPCLQTSWTDDNPGRRFKGCENWKNGGCNFFRWFDPPMCPRSMVVIPELRREKIRVASENDQLRQKISSLLDEKMNLERTIANMGFENSNMARRLCSLQGENSNQRRTICYLEDENVKLLTNISHLEDSIARLTTKNKMMQLVIVVSWMFFLVIWFA
ncbi:hypothetical protein BUALT_Bualt02G0153200 [Buddleja alternifolia]|uniref:GRF-type domain-containing protein n=1 Tax=Buddleja alternifolia TaxID=168488 RepID=A0AAV6YB75_9LAMI|nr:hypothetical protein BUALT_Bualt02G0153200 [Buddleja alternifolia]